MNKINVAQFAFVRYYLAHQQQKDKQMISTLRNNIAPLTGVLPQRVGLLNPAFVYVSSANTDIRKRFEIARLAQAATRAAK